MSQPNNITPEEHNERLRMEERALREARNNPNPIVTHEAGDMEALAGLISSTGQTLAGMNIPAKKLLNPKKILTSLLEKRKHDAHQPQADPPKLNVSPVSKLISPLPETLNEVIEPAPASNSQMELDLFKQTQINDIFEILSELSNKMDKILSHLSLK